MNFLKYILNQEEASLMKLIFNEQLKKPNQGDWVKTIKKVIRKLNINETLNEIKDMIKSSFKKLVKEKYKAAAFKYLKCQIKSKGNKIEYEDLEMQNYLAADSNLNKYAIHAYTHGPMTGSGSRAVRLPIG